MTLPKPERKHNRVDLDASSRGHALLAESLIKEPGRRYLSTTSRSHVGDVDVCLEFVLNDNVGEWEWTVDFEDDLVSKGVFVATTSSVLEADPAMVSWARAWSWLTTSSLRLSLWREYNRLFDVLQGYELLGEQHRLWFNCDMKLLREGVRTNKVLWLKTPEGFFASRKSRTKT